jgi:CheY-like chemotaxis protein
MLTRIIGDAYEISSVNNGLVALEALRNESFDLVLLDLLMPEMDGFAVLEAMKGMRRKPPVLVISADIQDTTRERVLKLGAVGLINKPPKKDQLLSALNTALISAGR